MWDIMKCLDLLAVNVDEISFVFIIICLALPALPIGHVRFFSTTLFKKTSATIKGKFSAEPGDMNRFIISVEDSGRASHAASDSSFFPSISAGRKSDINVVRSAVLTSCVVCTRTRSLQTFLQFHLLSASHQWTLQALAFLLFFFFFLTELPPEAAPA